MANCQIPHESKSAATIRRRRRKIPALIELISYRHRTAANFESLESDHDDQDVVNGDLPLKGNSLLHALLSTEHTLLLGLLAFRVINALFIQTAYVPDEYWQSLEVAHKMTFGYGYLTWEWSSGIRSYNYPLLFALMYKIIAIFGLDDRLLLIKLPKILQGIFAAVGDLYLYKFSNKMCGPRVAQWTLICQLTSWFTFYCCTRTLTNSMENVLSTIGLYYFPWPGRPRKAQWKYIALAGISIAIRPTAAILWTPFFMWHILMWRHVAYKVIKVFIKCGLCVLGISCYIDRVFYGRWIFVQYNFLHFNVISNLSTFYGSHPWHWYLTQGFPIIMGSHIFPFALAIRRNIQTICLGIIAWTICCYSVLGHKEFRFLFSILPIAMHVCGSYIAHVNGEIPEESIEEDEHEVNSDEDISTPEDNSTAISSEKSSPLRRVIIIFLMVTNLPLAIYTGLLHQRGTIDVTKYLADQTAQVTNKTVSIMSLMPCHSIPHYSYIHKNIKLRFLTCEPNIHGDIHHLDEADMFFREPEKWLSNEFENQTSANLPTHLILFDELQSKIKRFTKSTRYSYCAKFFHTHFPDGRVSEYVIVLCSPEWIESQRIISPSSRGNIDKVDFDMNALRNSKKNNRGSKLSDG